ncbi:MAG TPA: hypothetical protein PKW49_02630 [Paludibacteraceae bacterium]|nr:hypothetical protein [Paludibacteraceae bacterium]HQJ89059.1 hypothetical protein [Paludibacteraceae bacterium]
MKKVFNLSVILAVLMAAFSFTSCSDDEDNATVEITLDNNGAFNAGSAVTGSINAEAEIESITLFSVNGGAETSMAQQSAEMTKAAKGETAYSFRIEGLAIGTYKLTATDGDGNISSKTFTLGYSFSSSIEVAAGKTYIYSTDKKTLAGEFTVSAAETGSVTLTISSKTVTLSDAGNSYLSKAFAGINKAAAEASPADVLFILKANSKSVASGTEATSTIIKAGANPVYFAVK